MPCIPDIQNNRIIYSTIDAKQGYPSFIPTVDEGDNMILIKRAFLTNSKILSPTKNEPISDIQLYFAYFSLYILFPLLYNMLISGNSSVIMVLLRYITSGVYDTVYYVKEAATDMFYAALRMFGKYNFSTYTVVKDGREIYSASSLFYYYKSDVSSVYRIDRAKYDVCKWIDKQCRLFSKIHGVEPDVNNTHNHIYDFILHKVDNQPYTRIHRGDFTGRTHTLISEHYRPYKNSYQFASDAELIVHVHQSTVEPPIVSNATCDSTAADGSTSIECETNTCIPPFKFAINLKSPNNFFLEKNEILDAKFLQWKLYNEFGRDEIAKYLHSPFYNYQVNMYYNECMNEYFNDNTTTSSAAAKLDALTAPEVVEPDVAAPNDDNKPQTRIHAYHLNHQQSVIVGHTYIVKVDSLLRCPVFESNEKQVFDIDGVLSSYYDCSESDDEANDTSDDDTVSSSGSNTDIDGAVDDEDIITKEATIHVGETSTTSEKNDIQPNPVTEDTDFELIQEQ